jgi:hypothetical protein
MLALTRLTSGGRSAGIVRSRTEATELLLLVIAPYIYLITGVHGNERSAAASRFTVSCFLAKAVTRELPRSAEAISLV